MLKKIILIFIFTLASAGFVLLSACMSSKNSSTDVKLSNDAQISNSLASYASFDDTITHLELLIKPDGVHIVDDSMGTIKRYNIMDLEGLKAFRDSINLYGDESIYNSCTINLMCSIDISGENWTPIGYGENRIFSGRFYGNGNVITGLTINLHEMISDRNNKLWNKQGMNVYAGNFDQNNCYGLGFFGTCYRAEITNLLLRNVNIDVWAGYLTDNIGSLVGCAVDSSIESCMVYGGTVSAYESQRDDRMRTNFENASTQVVGGLVGNYASYDSGSSYLHIQDCAVYGLTLEARIPNPLFISTHTSLQAVGGIVGYVSFYRNDANSQQDLLTISQSYFSGNVILFRRDMQSAMVGGIVGCGMCGYGELSDSNTLYNQNIVNINGCFSDMNVSYAAVGDGSTEHQYKGCESINPIYGGYFYGQHPEGRLSDSFKFVGSQMTYYGDLFDGKSKYAMLSVDGTNNWTKESEYQKQSSNATTNQASFHTFYSQTLSNTGEFIEGIFDCTIIVGSKLKDSQYAKDRTYFCTARVTEAGEYNSDGWAENNFYNGWLVPNYDYIISSITFRYEWEQHTPPTPEWTTQLYYQFGGFPVPYNLTHTVTFKMDIQNDRFGVNTININGRDYLRTGYQYLVRERLNKDERNYFVRSDYSEGQEIKVRILDGTLLGNLWEDGLLYYNSEYGSEPLISAYSYSGDDGSVFMGWEEKEGQYGRTYYTPKFESHIQETRFTLTDGIKQITFKDPIEENTISYDNINYTSWLSNIQTKVDDSRYWDTKVKIIYSTFDNQTGNTHYWTIETTFRYVKGLDNNNIFTLMFAASVLCKTATKEGVNQLEISYSRSSALAIIRLDKSIHESLPERGVYDATSYKINNNNVSTLIELNQTKTIAYDKYPTFSIQPVLQIRKLKINVNFKPENSINDEGNGYGFVQDLDNKISDNSNLYHSNFSFEQDMTFTGLICFGIFFDNNQNGSLGLVGGRTVYQNGELTNIADRSIILTYGKRSIYANNGYELSGAVCLGTRLDVDWAGTFNSSFDVIDCREIQITFLVTPTEYTYSMWYYTEFNADKTPNLTEELTGQYNINNTSEIYMEDEHNTTIESKHPDGKRFGAWTVPVKLNSQDIQLRNWYSTETKEIQSIGSPLYDNANRYCMFVAEEGLGGKLWIYSTDSNNTIRKLLGLDIKTYYDDTTTNTRYFVIANNTSSLLKGCFGDYTSDKLILVRWSNEYSVNITNDGTGTAWGTSEDKPILEDRPNLVGVSGGLNSNNTTDTDAVVIDGYTIKLKLIYGANYDYKFFNNATKAFKTTYKNGEEGIASSNAGWYALHNYGYELSGYTISIDINGTTHYLKYTEDNRWDLVTTYTENDIAHLLNTNTNYMSLYAETLDSLILTTERVVNIRIIPVWTAVNVTAKSIYNGNTYEIFNGTFNSNYNYQEDFAPIGDSLAGFYYGDNVNGDNFVSLSNDELRWNYYFKQAGTISEQGYTHTEGTNYTISLNPYIVGNIYKVQLNAKDGTLYQTEAIENGEYTANTYTYKTLAVGDKQYTEPHGYYATTYAKELYALLAAYTTGCETRTLPILTTNGKTSVYLKDNAYWIYLANGYSYGDLPEFRREFYTQIAWDNMGQMGGENSTYSYTTSEYNEELHKDSLTGRTILTNGVWYLDQGYKTIRVSNKDQYYAEFNWHYFRKMYYIDPQVILTNEGKERDCGRIELVITDNVPNMPVAECKSGKYIYEYSLDNSGITLIREGVETTADEITLYAGCTIQILVYDQSKDNQPDKYIGYYYMTLAEDSDELFTSAIDETNKYDFTLTADTIEQKAYANATKLDLKANFAYITYTVNVSLDNDEAGAFRLQDQNGGMGAALTKNNISFTIDKPFSLTYLSNAGYELQTNAFVLTYLTNPEDSESSRVSNVLLTYNPNNINQTCTITPNASWIRRYYNNLTNETYKYSAEPIQNLGNKNTSILEGNFEGIRINTQDVILDLKVKVLDTYTNTWLNEEGYSLGKWQLSDETLSLRNAFTPRRVGTDNWYFYKQNETYYAVLNSYALYRSGDKTAFSRRYSYPQLTEPNEEFRLTSTHLTEMLNTAWGEIVPVENRQIYFVLEVHKATETTLQVEQQEWDTNYTTRKVNVSFGTGTTPVELTLTLDKDAPVVDGYYTETLTFMSYTGLNVNISAEYSRDHYTEVTLNEKTLTTPQQFNQSNTHTIAFIPRLLTAKTEYYLEDNKVEQSALAGILDNITVTADELVHKGSLIYIDYTLTDDNYTVEVQINDEAFANVLEEPYEVKASDYREQGVTIKFVVKMRPHNEITVQFAIKPSSEDTGDTFAYTVLADETELTPNEDGSYTAIIDREIKVRFKEETGYIYLGYAYEQGNQIYGEITEEGNEITLTLVSSFNPNTNGGKYTIYMAKEKVDALLTIQGDTQDLYGINTDDQMGEKLTSGTTLRDLYIGKTITFTSKPVDNEQLNYYYYTTKDGREVRLEGDRLEITSEVLENSNLVNGKRTIRLGVNTTPKYYLNVRVLEGLQYISYNAEDFRQDTKFVYYPKDTTVYLNIQLVEEEKYNVRLSGDTIATSSISFTQAIYLDDNKTINVTVLPKTFAQTITKYTYETIEQVQNNTPTEYTPTQEDYTQIGTRYNETATIRITKNKPTEELKSVQLKMGSIEFELLLKDDNQQPTFEVIAEDGEYEGNILTITKEDKKYVVEISEAENEITLRYTIKAEANITLTYHSTKTLTQKG